MRYCPASAEHSNNGKEVVIFMTDFESTRAPSRTHLFRKQPTSVLVSCTSAQLSRYKPRVRTRGAIVRCASSRMRAADYKTSNDERPSLATRACPFIN